MSNYAMISLNLGSWYIDISTTNIISRGCAQEKRWNIISIPKTDFILDIEFSFISEGDLAHEPVVGRELLRVLRRAALGRDWRDAVHHGDAGQVDDAARDGVLRHRLSPPLGLAVQRRLSGTLRLI